TLVTPIETGDTVIAFVNGEARTPVLVGQLWTVDAPTGSLVVVRIVKTIVQTFTTPFAFASDDDTVNAEGSTLPLVIFGGQGDDTTAGGAGGDTCVGGRGRVLYPPPPPAPPSTATGIDAATLAQLEALAGTVLGHGGAGDKTDGVARLATLAISVDTLLGGH